MPFLKNAIPSLKINLEGTYTWVPLIYFIFATKKMIHFYTQNEFHRFPTSKAHIPVIRYLLSLFLRLKPRKRVRSRSIHSLSTRHQPFIDPLPIRSQLWVAYAPCGSQHKDAVQVTLEQMDLIKRLAETYPKHLKLVLTSEGGLSRVLDPRRRQYLWHGHIGFYCRIRQIDKFLWFNCHYYIAGILLTCKNIGTNDAITFNCNIKLKKSLEF